MMSSASSVAPEATRLMDREPAGAVARVIPRWPGGHLQAVHGEVIPADVRVGDPVFATLRLPGGPPGATPAQVWRLSPLGVELVRPRGFGAVTAGTPVDVTLRVGRGTHGFPSLPVTAILVEDGRELLGLAFRAPPASRRAEDTRTARRWGCEGEYLPTGIAPSSARYGDFVYFRVAEISWTGMRLETSLRNKFLIPGARLEATCTFPTLGQVQLRLEVIHAQVVQRDRKQVLALGVRYASRQRGRARELIGQYLLQFGGGATVKELAAEGFRIPSSSRAFEFGHVRTAEEYAEVLHLRRLAYVHARKVGEDTKDVDMADGFDACSRILVARHHGRVVGTMRMSFPGSAADRLAHDGLVELPADLPPRDQMVELFKACTHPGYRGSDLFYALSRHAALTLVQSGRRFALVSATDALAPVYQRFGFRRLGLSYVHPVMRLPHHVLLADMVRSFEGEMNPIFWNLMDGYAAWTFARMCGLRTRPGTGLRLQAMRLLRPVALLLRWFYERRVHRRAAASGAGTVQLLEVQPADVRG